jgi:hypothetical protein
MAATIVDIAAAVTTELNTHSFSQSFTATRAYLPTFELVTMANLHVTVVPRSVASKSLDRQRDSYDYEIDVAVQQKVDPTLVNLDALVLLVEEIADHFRHEPLSNLPAARCVGVQNTPVYAAEHLQELRVFTSVLTLTFRLWK